jgi:hypothetical protein
MLSDKFKMEYYEIFNDDIYIFLGEIPNMPGHCVLLRNNDGKLFSGYHTENFIELTDEET